MLPTGYGKSLIYQILPLVFSEIYRMEYGQCDDNHVVIVVSPLEYIRVQQVESLKRMGVWAALLGTSPSDTPCINSESEFPQVLYGSAEQWLSDTWSNRLRHSDLGNVKCW